MNEESKELEVPNWGDLLAQFGTMYGVYEALHRYFMTGDYPIATSHWDWPQIFNDRWTPTVSKLVQTEHLISALHKIYEGLPL